MSFKQIKLVGIVLLATGIHSIDATKNGLFEDARYVVDFHESMDFFRKDSFAEKRIEKMNDPLTQFCIQLFEENNLQKLEPQEETIIPKIIHLIWVGPRTPPPVFDACQEAIKKYLPDWECKIWTDKDIPNLTLQNKEYYDQEKNYGAKSDLLRYELLYQFGGVYIDIDIVLLQPLDVLNHTYEFYTCLMPSYKWDVLANGVLASVPGHPILKYCIDSVKNHRERDCIITRTGPIHFQEAFHHIAKDLESSRVVALPRTFFFPFEQEHIGLPAEETAHLIKPESFAIHYWADSWSYED